MFPPIQCSKSSYFTQWLLSEYLNRVESGGGVSGGGGLMTPNSSSTSSSSTNSSSSSSKLTSPASAVELTSVASSDVTVAAAAAAAAPRSVTPPPSSNHHNHHHQQHHHHHHATFTALKQLFSSHTKHHGSSSSNNKSNNNEYKNNNGLPPQQLQHHKTDPLSSPKNIEFIQMLALNALEFTAPIYSFLNKKQTPEQEKQQQQSQQSPQQQDNNINLQHDKRQVATTTTAAKCPSTRTFVQLSGHPGSFAPAGPNSVWKKMPEDQGGSCCGRQQEGSGIGTSATLRELLQELSLKGDSISIEARRDSLKQSLALLTSPSSSPQRKVPPSCYLEEDTIPITVFFNSNGNDNDNPSASSASSSSNTTTTTSSTSTGGSSSTTATMTTTTTTLMPPQICNIPFHMLPNENQVYRRVNSASPPDPLTRVIPKYITETCYNSQMFLELEDLLTNFEHGHPTIMDIKLGTRTFLEAEVKNNKPRPDLYQKLISVDPTACTQQEHEQKAVTKLTYMMFREKQSSSNSLGFRVEGVKIGDNGEYKCDKQLGVNFKMLREEPEICSVITTFCKGNSKLVSQFLKRLELIRDTLEQSEFFMTHEVIGCSLLFIHDEISVDLRLIDFAKTFEVGGGGSRRITHREPWVMGNREDGVLTGIDSLIRLFKRLNDQGIIGSSGNSDGNSKHDHDDDNDDHDKRI